MGRSVQCWSNWIGLFDHPRFSWSISITLLRGTEDTLRAILNQPDRTDISISKYFAFLLLIMNMP